MALFLRCTVLAVVLAAGTALPAPAQAATTHRWTARHSFAGERAAGTYTRGGGKVTVRGYLTDTAVNGWAACIRVRYVRGTSKRIVKHVIYGSQSHAPLDAVATLTLSPTTYRAAHLYVQMCRVRALGGSTRHGAWKRLF